MDLSHTHFIKTFKNFQKQLNDHSIVCENKILTKIIKNYYFFIISDNSSVNQTENSKIQTNIQNSKLIIFHRNVIIDRIFKDKYLIVGFEKSVVIIKLTLISIIYELISTNPKLLICYLSNTKEIIGKAIYNLEININNMHFYNEINAFKKIFQLKDS